MFIIFCYYNERLVEDQWAERTTVGKQKNRRRHTCQHGWSWATNYFFTGSLQLLDKRWPIHQWLTWPSTETCVSSLLFNDCRSCFGCNVLLCKSILIVRVNSLAKRLAAQIVAGGEWWKSSKHLSFCSCIKCHWKIWHSMFFLTFE